MLGSTAVLVGRLDCKDVNSHFSGFLVFQNQRLCSTVGQGSLPRWAIVYAPWILGLKAMLSNWVDLQVCFLSARTIECAPQLEWPVGWESYQQNCQMSSLSRWGHQLASTNG